jgi:3-deoxy-D-manno-octulosonate 8-phosphate phosphatase (KDO 8-P phosphatase)
MKTSVRKTPARVRTRPPSAKELRERARHIKLVLTDNDGVLTDTGVYYGESGETMKRFSIRDGMGVERLRARGIETAIITGETSGSVRARARKLNMPSLYLGVKDKRAHLETILRETGLPPAAVAFIGDDVNDLAIIDAVNGSGITAAPADAMPEVAAIVHYRCRHRGGQGAFRDFAEWLLTLRAKD